MLPTDGQGQKKPNPRLEDGLEMEHGGKIYRLVSQKFVWTKNKASKYYGWTWPYYKIVDVHKKKIGRITTFTSDKRIESLLYRYQNPGHMSRLEYMGQVSTNARDRLYISIPKKEVKKHDIKVDDAVEITLERMDGERLTEVYHCATNTQNMNISLSRFKRYAKVEGKWEKLSYTTYKDEMRKHGNGEETTFNWFVKAGDYVKVILDPRPDRQCFDFTKESMKQIKKWVIADLKAKESPEDEINEELEELEEGEEE